MTRLHRPVSGSQVAVTSAGVNALMLASQLILDPGERVVEVVPLWPNLQEIPKILGAHVTTVALSFSPSGWRLDLERLIDALTPGTRALYLNSPNNPTGWTITVEEQKALLEHCRRHGIWIFADDAYERLYYGPGEIAPSFLKLADESDRLISANTFPSPGSRPGGVSAGSWSVRPGGGSRQADRVQHLVRAGVRAARRAGRGPARGAGDRAYPRALPARPRLSCFPIESNSSGAGGGASGHDVRIPR